MNTKATTTPDPQIVLALNMPPDATMADVISEIQRLVKEAGSVNPTEAQKALACSLNVPVARIQRDEARVRNSRRV